MASKPSTGCFKGSCPLSGPGWVNSPTASARRGRARRHCGVGAGAGTGAGAFTFTKPGERLAAMRGQKGFGADFFAAAGQTVRDESPRSLLKKHNAQLAKRGLMWRLSQQQAESQGLRWKRTPSPGAGAHG